MEWSRQAREVCRTPELGAVPEALAAGEIAPVGETLGQNGRYVLARMTHRYTAAPIGWSHTGLAALANGVVVRSQKRKTTFTTTSTIFCILHQRIPAGCFGAAPSQSGPARSPFPDESFCADPGEHEPGECTNVSNRIFCQWFEQV